MGGNMRRHEDCDPIAPETGERPPPVETLLTSPRSTSEPIRRLALFRLQPSACASIDLEGIAPCMATCEVIASNAAFMRLVRPIGAMSLVMVHLHAGP